MKREQDLLREHSPEELLQAQPQRVLVKRADGRSYYLDIPPGANLDQVKALADATEQKLYGQQPAPTQEVQPQQQPQAAAPPQQGWLDSFLQVARRGLYGNKGGPSFAEHVGPNPSFPETRQDAINLGVMGIEGGIGALATAGTAMTGVGAPVAGLAGSAAMSTTDQIIRHFMGQDTGSPLGFNNPIAAGIEGTLFNEIGGRVLGKALGRVGTALKVGGQPVPENLSYTEGLKSLGVSPELASLHPSTGGMLGRESGAGGVVSTVEDIFAPHIKRETVEGASKEALTQLESQVGTDKLFTQQNDAMDSLLEQKRERLLGQFFKKGEVVVDRVPIQSSGNPKKDMQSYLLSKIFRDNTTYLKPGDPTSALLNTKKMIDDWQRAIIADSQRDPENKILSKSTQEAFNTFLDATANAAGPMNQIGKYFAINTGRQALVATWALLSTAGAGLGSGTAELASAATFGMHTVAKWLSNPKAAPIFTALIKGAPTGMSLQGASRILVNAAKGEIFEMHLQDGRTVPAKIDATGQVKPLQ